MTAAGAIAKLDELYPNSYTTATKLDWINQIENTWYNEVVLSHDNPDQLSYAKITEENADATELMIPDPYSDCYVSYMMAQCDLFNAEIDRYNNNSIVFTSQYQTALDYWNRSHMPVFKTNYIY